MAHVLSETTLVSSADWVDAIYRHNGPQLGAPSLLKTLIDQIATQKQESMLLNLAILLISIYAVNTLLGMIQNYSLSSLSQKLVYSMSRDLYNHVQSLSGFNGS